MSHEPRSPRAPQPPSPPVGDAAEAARLAALHRYAILDTPEEGAFERLAELARDLLHAPAATVSLVSGRRQWFKAHPGLAFRETPRELSFCTHAVRPDAPVPFVVPDARADPRFADNPLVTGPPHIRFYAGAPLVTPEGHRLGTVAVNAPEPRPQGLSGDERRWLQALAALAMDELELRLQRRRATEEAVTAETARAAERRLRRAQEAAGVVAFEFGAGGAAEASEALRTLYGLPPQGPIDFAAVVRAVHPEDRAALVADRERLAAEGGPFHHQYRVVLPDGGIRWLEARGRVERPHDGEAAAGPPRRTIGVVLDVTARKEAEARQALLAREVDHRAKNALAVVQSVLRLTSAEDARAYAAAVEGRIAALARAQTLLAKRGWAGAGLRTVVEGELAPFVGASGSRGAAGPQAVLDGPPVALTAHAVQPLSMVLHELATNAVKHGALSAPGGRVALTWRLEPGEGDGGDAPWRLRLRWTETGGPRVPGPPGRRGFGTRLLDATVEDQLGGRITRTWKPAGLVCDIALPETRVLARAG